MISPKDDLANLMYSRRSNTSRLHHLFVCDIVGIKSQCEDTIQASFYWSLVMVFPTQNGTSSSDFAKLLDACWRSGVGRCWLCPS